jgi:Flp pilus assembly pilin Flp
MRRRPGFGTVCDIGLSPELRETKMQAEENHRARDRVAHFVGDDSGATAVEYGIMVAAISAVIVAVVLSVGSSVHDDLFLNIDTLMETLPS